MNGVFSLGMDSSGPSTTNSPTPPSTCDAGSTRSCSASRKFPAGLRVLVVDDDPLCLKIVEKILRNCQYDVTTCSRAAVALSLLRERKGSFDLVLSDVYMPDMDGFKLLELIGLEMDLPVIMMSADDSKDVVMKGVTHGAVDYMIKPVSMEVAKNLWQHIARKNMCNDAGSEQTTVSVEENDRQKKVSDDGDNALSGNGKRRKDEMEGENEQREDSSSVKKPRVVWSVELHQEFISAVQQLTAERAVPKKILEIMKVPGLTRENVASHLQKYRLYLKKAKPDTPPQGVSDGTYGPIDAINGFSHPHENHMNMNVGTRRGTSSGIGMAVVDGLNYISSNPQISNAMRMVSGQQWSRPGQMNFITGASFDMGSQQSQQVFQAWESLSQKIGNNPTNLLNPSASLCANTSFGAGSLSGHPRNSMIMQMPQQGQHLPMSRQQSSLNIDVPRQALHNSQLLNGIASEHDSRMVSNISQQVLFNDTSVYGQAPLTGTMTEPSSYGLAPQALYSDLQNNYSNVSVGNSYPFGMSTANLNSTVMFQEGVPSSRLQDWNKPGLRGVKNAIQTEDWKFQSTYPSSELPQHPNINFSCSISAPTDLIASVKDGNTCAVSKEVCKIRSQLAKLEPVSRQNSTVLFDYAVGPTSDGLPDLSCQDDLLGDTLLQNNFLDMISQQDFGEHLESDFDISSYPLGGNFQ